MSARKLKQRRSRARVSALPVGRRTNEPVALDFALHGGDDYELLFTSSKPVPPKVEGVPITFIGRTTRKKGLRLIDADGRKQVLESKGWEHFRKRS